MQQDREEDSGLHDIRNLAQSTKQRLSKRGITSPPIDDDMLSASSGAFKNIALPQPAKMVSLPAVEELPSKAEVAAAEKAAKKAGRESKKDIAAAAAVTASATSAASSAAIEAPAPIVPARSAFTLPSQQRKSSKGPVLAILGLGLAAAAGGVIFMQVNKDSASSPAAVSSSEQAAPAAAPEPAKEAAAGSAAAVVAAPTVEPIEVPAEPAPAAGATQQLATDDVKAADTEAKVEADKAESKATKKNRPAKGGKAKADEKAEPKKIEEKQPEKIEVKKPVATKGGGEAEGEPSFDALLKEAGVDGAKKEVKPKLEKKALTGDDFKKGIGAVAGKAKGCYKGTQGTAMLKIVIAPSGSVSKVTVSGEFAGTPEGTCVESSLKGASFPPWDGGPQTFTYSVLLSD
ncbi:MAG TPA: hypothetical protein VIV11_18715 [Kofleriaceae bacterium]